MQREGIAATGLVLLAVIGPLLAATDPDIFDGRLAPPPASDPSDPSDLSDPSDRSDRSDQTPARDYEAVSLIGGEPVTPGGSKESAAAQTGGGTSGNQAETAGGNTGGAPGGGASGAAGAGEAAGGTGGGDPGGERSFEQFEVGAGGTVETVEVNRSKVGLPAAQLPAPPGGEASAGTGEPQPGAAGTPPSGPSDVDTGTHVPAGL